MTPDDRLRAAAEEYSKKFVRLDIADDGFTPFLAGAKYERDRAEVLLEALGNVFFYHSGGHAGAGLTNLGFETAKQAIAAYRER